MRQIYSSMHNASERKLTSQQYIKTVYYMKIFKNSFVFDNLKYSFDGSGHAIRKR